MSAIKYFGSLLMVSLFAFALIMFAVKFADDNNTAYSLEYEEGFNTTKNNLQGSITTFHSDVNTSSGNFYDSEITLGETVRKGGHFKTGPQSTLSQVNFVINQGFTTIFGNSIAFGVFLTALTSFLVFVAVLYIWKIWAGRNPN